VCAARGRESVSYPNNGLIWPTTRACNQLQVVGGRLDEIDERAQWGGQEASSGIVESKARNGRYP
jgi:hypothetical protein